MSHSNDYLTRLVAKTARDDAALIARFGPIRVSDENSAELLRALAARWPLDPFDETNVAVDATGISPGARRLRRALACLGPVRRRRWRGPRQLSKANEIAVWRWFLAVDGRPIEGLLLRRNPIDWCEIEPVAGFRQ